MDALCGVASVGLRYYGTAFPTKVQIGDCRGFRGNWQDDCGVCVTMYSSANKMGYVGAWAGSFRKYWLNVVALS